MRRPKSFSWPLFLSGVFSMTQINIGGNIGFSELVMCAMAPVVYIKDQNIWRKDKCTLLMFLLIATIVGCGIGCYVNETDFSRASRGLAATYAFWAGIVCFYHMLRKNPNGWKWALLGIAISTVINTFFFHYGAEGAMVEGTTGMGAAATMAEANTLFWVGRLEHWLQLPIRGWYLQTPLVYSVLAPLLLAIYCVAGTSSGRSAALGVLGCSFVVLIGGKTMAKMRKISKYFMVYIVMAFIGVLLFKGVYTYCGNNNLLNESQQKKYDAQTKGGRKTGLVALLMSGRAEFFCGVAAACRRPITGYGPWPIDEDGFAHEFMAKYGDVEDWKQFEEGYMWATRDGRRTWLPAHSIVIGFWLWFGIFGFLLWCYILYTMVQYLRKYITVVPQWFGYLAAAMPAYLWHIFFSPFGGRLTWALYVAVLFLNRAIAIGSVKLPWSMQEEILKMEE